MKCLPPPDYLADGEGYLLFGFEPDDAGYPFRFDRRKLDKAREAALARDRDGHLAVRNVVPGQELT